MILLAACGSDSTPSSTDNGTNQTETQNNKNAKSQTAENNPPKDWEKNSISDFDYRYDDELQGVAVSYKGESETVWFPSEVNGDPVVAIEEMKSPKVVKEVYIPEGIKILGPGAFSGCQNLTSVVIPEGVTEIDGYAFEDCKNLSSVVLPDSVTHIGGSAFWKCTSLTSLELPSNLKVLGMRSLGSVPLTNVILPEGLEVIGDYAFGNCNEITSIVIPSSVTTIEQLAFSGCEKLAEITLADPDAILDIGYEAFKGTYWYNKHPDGFVSLGSNLVAYKGQITETKLVIPDGIKTIASQIAEEIYDTPSIENVTEIVLPDGLKRIGGSAFQNASSLITVNIPDSVEYIGDNAFGYSDSLDAASKERIRQINPEAL